MSIILTSSQAKSTKITCLRCLNGCIVCCMGSSMMHTYHLYIIHHTRCQVGYSLLSYIRLKVIVVMLPLSLKITLCLGQKVTNNASSSCSDEPRTCERSDPAVSSLKLISGTEIWSWLQRRSDIPTPESEENRKQIIWIILKLKINS